MSRCTAPADRRAFLGSSLALASTLAASTAASAGPAILADHPDAELIAMGGAIASVQRRQQQFAHEVDEAYERFEEPDIPDALFFRPDDAGAVRRHSEGLMTCERGGERAPYYYNGVADLSGWAQRYAVEGAAYDNMMFADRHRARVREIAAAHEAWQDAVARAEDEAGITAPAEAVEREELLIEELRRRIAATPAGTLDGMVVKARAANISLADDPTWAEREYLPMLLARWDNSSCHAKRFEVLAVSLVADALRLGLDPATSGKRSAV